MHYHFTRSSCTSSTFVALACNRMHICLRSSFSPLSTSSFLRSTTANEPSKTLHRHECSDCTVVPTEKAAAHNYLQRHYLDYGNKCMNSLQRSAIAASTVSLVTSADAAAVQREVVCIIRTTKTPAQRPTTNPHVHHDPKP